MPALKIMASKNQPPKPSVGRPPKQAAGKIKFAWAKTRDDGPDWFAVWQQPADKGTSNLVLTELSKLAAELVKRGYDPKSIRFECARPAKLK